jgi:hypothetical protein
MINFFSSCCNKCCPCGDSITETFPSYVNMRQHCGDTDTGTIHYRGFDAFLSQGFFFLVDASADDTPECRFIERGWKFHISISDTNSAETDSNLSKAWDIIAYHLIENRVYATKVTLPGKRSYIDNPLERGNEITIYAYRDLKTPAQWQQILQSINNDLLDHRILPGYEPPPSSHIISNYISYCHDQ